MFSSSSPSPPLVVVHPPAPATAPDEVGVLFLNHEDPTITPPPQEDPQYFASSSSSPSTGPATVDDDDDDYDDGLVYGFESDGEYGFPYVPPPRPKAPPTGRPEDFTLVVVCGVITYLLVRIYGRMMWERVVWPGMKRVGPRVRRAWNGRCS